MLSAAPLGAAQAKLNVFACVPEWAALAEAIGGDGVEVTLATSALDNPDAIKPTPALIADLKDADLIVCTGAGLEDAWLEPMIERSGNAGVAPGQPGHFLASAFVTLLEDSHGGEEEDEEEGHLHEEGNPHIQGDPRNVLKVAAQLAKRLSVMDAENKAAYGQNAKAFIGRMNALIGELEQKAAPLKGVNIAVQHEHSLYLLEWLGVEAAATVEPEPGVPPGPQHLAAVIEAVPARDMKFVIHAAYEDPGPSKFVSDKAGIPLVNLPFTVGGTPEAKDLFSLYEDSVARLLDGLQGRGRS
ncbi:metal ABC transporter substrate-binding protein [Arenibaculum sp.]|uniref:metal ABC transporter substrate-binding protein n=1 Tax=Arenibaculum sp. TaxID=2865862 RepID=UPI002E0E15A9|nr:zinc ABC transporter substrate-binding protein [Arenibaculum sp.]